MKSLATLGNELYAGRTSIPFVGKRKLWYIIASCAIVISLICLATIGLQPGIEFKGGTQVTITSVKDPKEGPANDVLAKNNLATSARVSTTGSSSVRVQTPALDAQQLTGLKDELAQAYSVGSDDVAATTIGPSWGKDVSAKALRGLVIFFVLVGVLIWVYFRTWKMSVAALLALTHDVIITVGVYSLSRFEVTPATVIGVLTILGYSLYDTVVVFDKIRENTADVLTQKRSTYGELANLAVNQTFVRSINTSVVGLLPVASILFIGSVILGAGTLRDISLTLFIGMIAGAASSIFLATPLLVDLRSREADIKAHDERVLEERGERRTQAEARGETIDDIPVAAPVRPGHHLGHAAQPKRKKKS
ncbi:protein translocase subunit SecF [Actinomyces vulturis]|uniref:protein translocase subunit SecF n=1 Tax=Actinomyces vulturis TaxID=1857645 RepID=UPI0008325389|nr:protein translocase subunit SecF [Actinomyces vulturis]